MGQMNGYQKVCAVYVEQWHSTIVVRLPPDVIPFQLFTPKVVGV
jgi:hypothetical protein